MHIAPSVFLFIEPASRIRACVLDNNRIRPHYIRDIGILFGSINSEFAFLQKFAKKNVIKKGKFGINKDIDIERKF